MELSTAYYPSYVGVVEVRGRYLIPENVSNALSDYHEKNHDNVISIPNPWRWVCGANMRLPSDRGANIIHNKMRQSRSPDFPVI